MSDKKTKRSPLDFDPFEGDFGEPGDKIFSDKMVAGRKPYQCFHCAGPIVEGETHRSRYEKADGEMMSFRWCAACCDAMVVVMNAEDTQDDFEEDDDSLNLARSAFDDRHNIGGKP